MKKLFILFLLYLGLCLGVASAQPLATLAPDDTVASFSWSSSGSVLDTLGDDLVALEWERAGETLDKLVRGLAELTDDRDMQDILEAYEMMIESYQDPMAGSEMILEVCPNYEPVLEANEAYLERYGKSVPFEALLTVGISPYSPIPSVTALMRADESTRDMYALMQETLLECARSEDLAEISELEQNGVTLYVVGDAGDFPVVAGSIDDLYFIGSNPDAVRGVVRKAMGADEPSFADSALYERSAASFGDSSNSVGFTLDLAALTDTLQGFAGFLGNDPELSYLIERASAMLRTLGGVTGQISLTPEGLVSESLFAINPEGGDPALLELVLCDSCKVSAPFLAPEGTVGVSASYIPWRELWTYTQDWLRGAEAMGGERLDVKALIKDELGLDLDVALFNWLGSEVQTYTLEPFSPHLRTMLYNPAQVSVIPVSSPEAARAGLEELSKVLGPVLEEIMSEIDPDMGDFNPFDMDGMGGMGSSLAVTEYSYKGVDITRIRMSFNTDFAYALVGNYLVIGAPQGALESVIDTFQGERSLLSSGNYMTLRTGLPASLTNLAYSDVSANLAGVAELFDILSQPLAFAASTGLEALALESSFDNFGDLGDLGDFGDLGYADIHDVTPTTIDIPVSVDGSLTEDEMDSYGFITEFYALSLGDAQVGDTVNVNLSSTDFDAYLSLIDANTETYIAENDDMGDSLDSGFSFVVEEGGNYWLEVTSLDGTETGDYTLSTELVAGEPMADEEEMDEEEMVEEEAAELPNFAELLELFDLLPQTLDVFAQHTSTSEGYSFINGDTVYSRHLTRIDW